MRVIPKNSLDPTKNVIDSNKVLQASFDTDGFIADCRSSFGKH